MAKKYRARGGRLTAVLTRTSTPDNGTVEHGVKQIVRVIASLKAQIATRTRKIAKLEKERKELRKELRERMKGVTALIQKTQAFEFDSEDQS